MNEWITITAPIQSREVRARRSRRITSSCGLRVWADAVNEVQGHAARWPQIVASLPSLRTARVSTLSNSGWSIPAAIDSTAKSPTVGTGAQLRDCTPAPDRPVLDPASKEVASYRLKQPGVDTGTAYVVADDHRVDVSRSGPKSKVAADLVNRYST